MDSQSKKDLKVLFKETLEAIKNFNVLSIFKTVKIII